MLRGATYGGPRSGIRIRCADEEGRRSYKTDTKRKQTDEQHRARHDLFAEIVDGKFCERYGIIVDAEPKLCDDLGADHLDAPL